MSLSPAFLDELRGRTALSGVIGRTTRLTKAGHEFKACCPFHDEKSPSFTVNDDKGFYHCFGCGAHGDAIRWLTDQRGLSFMDAVKELAQEAGMELPAPDPRAAQVAEQRETLHDVMRGAQDWFVANLASDRGVAARAYLARRGIDAATAARFGFGLALEDRNGLKSALARFPEAMLVEAGLLISVEGRDTYDRFRSRLMLPIEDMRGRVIAFGGRILDAAKTDAPKYLNSPDTPLFDKGATLYNLNRAAVAARKSGRLIVVEGYMDVIALAVAGIDECVAPMGTALTERQIELLWRQVETPILCLDGDAAGSRAAMRAATRALPMLKPGHSLRIVHLPGGLDPDDLVRRDGAAAMETLFERASSLLDALWQHERDAETLSSPEAKAGLKARLMVHVDTIKDRDIRALYRRDLLELYSEYAYPHRDWSSYGANVVALQSRTRKGFGPIDKLVVQRMAEAKRDPRTQNYSSLVKDEKAHASHLRKRLGAALVVGFMNWPTMIFDYIEVLTVSPMIDERLLLIVDVCQDAFHLGANEIVALLIERGPKLPDPSEYDGFRFPFIWPPPNAHSAPSSLRKAMSLYVVLPAVRVALELATQRLARDTTDDAFAEQQQLLRRKMELDGNQRKWSPVERRA